MTLGEGFIERGTTVVYIGVDYTFRAQWSKENFHILIK